jgi:hypothetical protein
MQSVADHKKARAFASLPAVAPTIDLRDHLRRAIGQQPPPPDPDRSGGPHTAVRPLTCCASIPAMRALMWSL